VSLPVATIDDAQEARPAEDELELTVLMPCLNEAETVGTCIDKAIEFLRRSGIRGEVLVADNSSVDGSVAIALAKGARVVEVSHRGYGAALQQGIKSARGRYVIMGDADSSYDFGRLDLFLDELRAGSRLVIGNRFAGGIAPGAMPPLHRYLGNPLLSFLGRLFFSARVRDFHCGLRGFDRESLLALQLKSTGMEFASEMVIRCALARLKITEVPTTLSPDGRTRPPHLRSWQDGWRHLRLLLLFAPNWLFLYPGALILAFGTALTLVLLQGPVSIFPNVTLDIHSLIVGCMAILVGGQCLSFWIVARRYAASRGWRPPNRHLDRLGEVLRLEHVLLGASVVTLGGLLGIGYSIFEWAAVDFGPMQYGAMIRILMVSCTLVAIGLQIIFTAFLAAIFAIDAEHEQR
jgi:hypothetical protein